MTSVVGATVTDGQGLGTIVNDDVLLTQIHDIQGPGISSPLVGQTVSTRGIVTAVASNGFYVQEPDGTVDADPNTSEGIFVFTSSAPPAAAAVGNQVQITGTVLEFVPSADPNSRPLTEITGPTVLQVSTGNPLPAPVLLTAPTVSGGVDQLEKYEGMRVQVGSLTVVAPTSGSVDEVAATATSNGVLYAVFPGVATPFREAGIAVEDVPANPATACAAGAGCALPVFDANPERIRVDTDGITGQAAINVNTGATLSNVVGVLTYGFRTYSILPTQAPTVGGTQVTVVPAPTPGAGTLSIVAANVERLYDTANDAGSDVVVTQTALDGRLNKLSLAMRNVLKSPDVIALEEVENLTVLQALATKINDDTVAGGGANPGYQAHLVEGNDVGGIDVGFLVKSTRVSVTSVTQLGSALTYTNPCTGASDTLNDRPSLRLRGTTNTIGFLQSFTIFVNHLRSLNGVADTTPCTLSTDGARVRAKRAAQANYVAGLVQDELTANPLAKIVVVVDFNAFEVNDGFTDVINTIAGSPAPATQVLTSTLDPAYPNLTNLLTLLPPAQRFSYLFDGNHQTLDHALLNPAAMTHFLGGGYARVNAEFNEFGFRGNFNTPERYSDHDPVYVYLSTQANLTAQTLITKTVPAFNRQTRLYSSTVTLKNNLPSPLNGPIKVVIMGLPATATPTNATVVTPSAATYELVGPLAAGATVSVPVVFSMPATVPVNFSVAVFATLPPV